MALYRGRASGHPDTSKSRTVAVRSELRSAGSGLQWQSHLQYRAPLPAVQHASSVTGRVALRKCGLLSQYYSSHRQVAATRRDRIVTSRWIMLCVDGTPTPRCWGPIQRYCECFLTDLCDCCERSGYRSGIQPFVQELVKQCGGTGDAVLPHDRGARMIDTRRSSRSIVSMSRIPCIDASGRRSVPSNV